MSSEPPPTTATDSANELKASIAPRRDDDRTLRPEGSQATNAYTGDGQGTKAPGDTQVLQTEDEVKIGIVAPEEVPQEAGDAPEVPQGGGHTPAVQIEGLELWYGSGAKRVDIFKGVNMRVPRGGIYALLGSSGCGKTTLLRCIMGRKHFQKGTIRVFGLQPGTPGSKIPGANVGYMPQELALYNAFSIEETLHFFARLYNLSPEQCSERAEFLIGLLDIPDRNRLVSYLSGGQKRRLSLAVSLIHSPPFLILDEPTVGIDPVLRKTIWSHLHTLSERDKMTIIITTHYIDEARLASTVSFLREGEILAEESPAKLMEVHQTRNLEEIFLRLARQEKSALPEVVIGGERSPDHERTQLSFMASTLERRPALNKKDLGRSLSRIGVMFSKNVIKFRRSFGLVLYSMLLPAIEVTMFCYVLGKVPTGLRIAVVNEEVAPPGSTTPLLSTAFVEALDRSILPQISYDTIDKGIDSVKAGVTYGVVHAKYNLTDSLVSRFSPTVPVTEPLLDFASLHAYLDMSNQQVFRTVQHYMGQALAEALPSTSINMLHFQSVLVREDPVIGSREPTFTEFVAPGMILTFIYFISAGLCINTLLGEKGDGLLERCIIAGVRPYEVVLAHVCSLSFVVVAQDLLLLFVGFVIFELPTRGPIYAIVVIAIMQGMCGMTLGLLCSAILETATTAALVVDGVNYPIMMISGILWPLEGIPKAIRFFSYVMPLTLPADALRSVMSKGWGLSHPNVLTGLLVNTGWATFFLVACMILFRQ
ncbi:ABC transporter G family member 23-like [Amblyomma americanum]